MILFYLRALRTARRLDDDFGRRSGTRPRELAQLIRLARGRIRVAELGTGAAWTAIALAISDPARTIVSYDPVVRPQREAYLDLVEPSVRKRIELIRGAGESGAERAAPVELVFVDSSHERDETIAAFEAWRGALEPGGVMAFHDFDEPLFPGVTEAIRELGLEGRAHGHLFVWQKPASGLRPADQWPEPA